MQAATQAIETTGTTDAQHHLVLDETLPITGPTRVRVGRLMPEESDLNGTEWLRAAADPAICHGEPTFRGTRLRVADVLEQVESGMAWEAIIEEWRYAVTRDAIAEAVRMARVPRWR